MSSRRLSSRTGKKIGLWRRQYERMAEALVKAWESRAVGAVARGLGHAVVGHNRRVVYADGRAQVLVDRTVEAINGLWSARAK